MTVFRKLKTLDYRTSYSHRGKYYTLGGLLDEKQRRLYAGLESHKLGHGGDRRIAELLGVDVHTVSRGRQELFVGEVLSERVRKGGGGGKRAEKNA